MNKKLRIFLIIITFIILILLGLFYINSKRKFLDLSIGRDVSIKESNEYTFQNISSEEVKNKKPLDYLEIELPIEANNKSIDFQTTAIKLNIILPDEIDKNDCIDIGENPLYDGIDIVSPNEKKALPPYIIFLKKDKYSDEELLNLLKKSEFKAHIYSIKNCKLSFLTLGLNVEYISKNKL